MADLTCPQDELIARLKTFPAEQEFDIHDPKHLVQWCNGHCFYWSRQTDDGEWNCEEL